MFGTGGSSAFSLGAVTSKHVRLFDLRYMKNSLVSWVHNHQEPVIDISIMPATADEQVEALCCWTARRGDVLLYRQPPRCGPSYRCAADIETPMTRWHSCIHVDVVAQVQLQQMWQPRYWPRYGYEPMWRSRYGYKPISLPRYGYEPRDGAVPLSLQSHALRVPSVTNLSVNSVPGLMSFSSHGFSFAHRSKHLVQVARTRTLPHAYKHTHDFLLQEPYLPLPLLGVHLMPTYSRPYRAVLLQLVLGGDLYEGWIHDIVPYCAVTTCSIIDASAMRWAVMALRCTLVSSAMHHSPTTMRAVCCLLTEP